MSATSIIGPPMMTNLFAYFTGPTAPVYFPGSAFLLGSIFMMASAIWAYYALRSEKHIVK
jgi:DHA1 family tetracycline resistance protein-like MFS transporter